METNRPISQAIDKSVRNATLIGYIRTFSAIPIYFLLTPFVLKTLGNNYYGLWSLNAVILTCYALGDFGFQTSLVHFTAKNLDDKTKLATLFNTIFVSFFILAFSSFFLISIFKGFLINSILRISPEYFQEAQFVITSSAAMLFIRFLSSPYEAIIQGNQRVSFTQLGSFCWLLFNSVGTYVGLKIYPSIYSLGIVNILSSLMLFVFYYAESTKTYSYTKLDLKLINMHTIREVLPYSMWIQVTSILISLREPLIKTIISRRFGLESLAAFEIAYRLTVQGMSIITVPLLTTLTVTSLLHDKPEILMRYVQKYMLSVSIALIFPCLFLWYFSDVFIEFWLGSQYSAVSILLPWLFLAYSISYLTEPLFKTVQGLGRPKSSACAEIAFVMMLLLSLNIFPQALGILNFPYSLAMASIVFSIMNVINFKLALRQNATRNSLENNKFQLARDVSGYLRRLFNRAFVDQWYLMARLNGQGTDDIHPDSLHGFKPITPPRDRFWADPFILFKDGIHYVFFEELVFSKGKGHISVIEIDERGKLNALPSIVLERDYHLSYPFVFEWEGCYYMVPETHLNNSIEIYKCVDFPARWEYLNNLIDNICASDTTLFHHEGKWWLFTFVPEYPTPGDKVSSEKLSHNSGGHLLLYYSNELFDKTWTPHPMNPLISGTSMVRPGGRIIRRGGKIYRPSQDCTKRYGYAVKMGRIDKLTETEYVEKEVWSMEPKDSCGFVAFHTYSTNGNLTIIDAARSIWSPRLYRLPKIIKRALTKTNCILPPQEYARYHEYDKQLSTKPPIKGLEG